MHYDEELRNKKEAHKRKMNKVTYDQTITHKIQTLKGKFQVLCMLAKGETSRVRNVCGTSNSGSWSEVTCPKCLEKI